ncbi:MAG: L,D-transpeptidase family protein [Burkholderiaceae bacterium]
MVQISLFRPLIAALAGVVLLAGLAATPAFAEEPFLPGKTRPPAKALPAAPMTAPAVDGMPSPSLPADAYERVRLYAGEPELLWLDRGLMPAAHAWTMAGLLDDAASDGLDRDDYAVSEIARRFEELAVAPAHSIDDPRLLATDRLVTESVLRFLRHLHLGRMDPARAHRDVKLPTRSFDAEALLAEALRERTVTRLRERAAPPMPMYERLRLALADYRSIAARPVPTIEPLPARGKLEPGEHWNGVGGLAQLLHVLGDLPRPAVLADTYEPELVEAVRSFQHRHGLDVDGVIGRQTHAELSVPISARIAQIELALERFRWLPEVHADTFVAINIPAFRLWAFDHSGGGEPDVWQTRIVVGNTGSGRTPIFVDRMSWIEFNPYWHVPRSITRRELLPKLHEDPFYLERQSMRILDRQGMDAGPPSPELLEGLADGSYRIRQDPGASNALGKVKFVMPNDMAIFLHDTPSRGLFSRAQRAFSHGCIRVEAPETLAQRLLANTGKWPESSIQQAIDSGERTIAGLRQPIPVVIFYVTTMVDADGSVRFYPDVYGYDRDALASLRTVRRIAANEAG